MLQEKFQILFTEITLGQKMLAFPSFLLISFFLCLFPWALENQTGRQRGSAAHCHSAKEHPFLP